MGVLETLMKRIMRKHAKTVEEPDVVVLSEEEEKRFVKELYGLLLLYTGMRVGEALALRYEDVDVEYGIPRINKSASMVRNHDEKADRRQTMMEGTTKNQQARNIVLNSDARNILELIRRNAKDCSPDALVITTQTGRQSGVLNDSIRHCKELLVTRMSGDSLFLLYFRVF